jgi:hypothetical protein
MSHFVLITLHLFAAIMFVGTFFFELLILEGVADRWGGRRCERWKQQSVAAHGA